MKFKEWLTLNELGTGTSSVAVFARPIFGGLIRRSGVWGEQDPFFKKRRKNECGPIIAQTSNAIPPQDLQPT